jgi:hypothetical protein
MSAKGPRTSGGRCSKSLSSSLGYGPLTSIIEIYISC